MKFKTENIIINLIPTISMKKVFLFALICGMFIGCSDNEGPITKQYSKAEITGAWEITSVSPQEKVTDHMGENMVVVFDENSNKFEGSFALGENYIGTYSISGSNVICTNLAVKPADVPDAEELGDESLIAPDPNQLPEPEPEPEAVIIGMDYYISDIYNNVYNGLINLKIAGISAEQVNALDQLILAINNVDEPLTGEELAAAKAERDELMVEINTSLEELIGGVILSDKETGEFFVEERSTVALFVLNATYDDGKKVTKQLQLKKIVE